MFRGNRISTSKSIVAPMILRLSAKLAKKIKTNPQAVLPADENPFADWSAHLFTADRTQYIILTNTTTLYSTLLYGRGISDDNRFLDQALTTLREFMALDGLGSMYQRFVSPVSGEVRFSKALNRSVTGSVNDLIQAAKWLTVEKELSPFDVAEELNKTPMSMLKYGSPRDAFVALGDE